MSTTNSEIVHTLLLPVRWCDQDKYGHVNNVACFQYFEEARGQWLASQGFQMDGQGLGPVLIHQEATYLKEINYPCLLKIETYLFKPGNTSLKLFHRVVDSKNDALYAEGNVKLVWVDHGKGKSIPLPDKLREVADRHGTPHDA